jgi:hypothetical protein
MVAFRRSRARCSCPRRAVQQGGGLARRRMLGARMRAASTPCLLARWGLPRAASGRGSSHLWAWRVPIGWADHVVKCSAKLLVAPLSDRLAPLSLYLGVEADGGFV